MSSKVNALIISGEGINCETETMKAFEYVGCNTLVKHIDDLARNPSLLEQFEILAIPGGFSYGDEIKSGKILALKMKKYLEKEIIKFDGLKKPILGICNGFQVLSYLNIFDDSNKQLFALEENNHKKFMNQWVKLNINQNSECIWTKGINESLEMPIRHGEGRVVFNNFVSKELIRKLSVFNYDEDVNGSTQKIAGITSLKGNVLALMPHPEAALFEFLNPRSKSKGQGFSRCLHLFENAKNYCIEKGYSR